ncbi:TetR/AcrR family transcriptional regulator [Sphingopyxis yananensis]|uniref:TetR/AcrR family transcriptional regulator n=1 Tax=Sphingopyxis yananensis TaxID=2886687 RepID=UPI001D10CA79|nr:helix-turn-helix domain-containing protein [Sphingopyxis yananensis]MCC2603140.1 TetR/AcrR family transcriptional regulator [Sphingopyxis yananensis]
MTDYIENNPPKARARGRPRRLELDKIIDAALHIGLNKLTMASVAEHLGVGKAVLYGYVANREELVRIAASRASSRYAFPQDEHDHWAIWTLRYCQALFDVLSQDGDMLEFWLNGQQSMTIEIDSTEMWLRILSRAGIRPLTVLQVRRGASHLVIGAAGAAKRARALCDLGRSRSQVMPKIIAGRSKRVAPLIHELKGEIGRDDQHDGWENHLFWLLCGAIGHAAGPIFEAHAHGPAAGDYDALFRLLPAALN